MPNNIKKVQVVIENKLATTEKDSKELCVTAFNRALRKLTLEKSGIGKLFPVYIKIDGIVRILAIFTLNHQGSTSIFFELPDGDFFDHITLGKNLSNNDSHLTKIDNGLRKKVSQLNATPLSNGTYHLLTLIIQDVELLKVLPRKVIFPEVNIEQFELLKDALVTNGDFNGCALLEPTGTEGAIVIQLFIIPKGIDFKNLQFILDSAPPLLNYFKDVKKLENIEKYISYLKHEFQDDYQIGLLTFRYPEKLDAPFYLGYSVDNSKIFFNSSDDELNVSVAKNILKK